MRLDPGDSEARLMLALALLGRDPQIAADAESPRARALAYLDLGQLSISRGEMAEAASWLREALRLEPDLVPARASLGLALYGMGDLDAAAEELGAIRRTRPDLIQARLTLAAVFVAKQDWPSARAELEALVAMRPDLAQAHYTLGVVRYTQGDVDGALDSYRRVLAVDPNHQDARYHVALMLKVARRDAEATPEFVAAAEAGLPRAQYFAGAAYAAGLGVERDLPRAVAWWFLAAEHGVPQAEEALAQLRQQALGRDRRGGTERERAIEAFRAYRTALRKEFPDVAPGADEPLGAALLREGRVNEGVSVLIREASALSEPAERALEALYVEGVSGQLPAYDGRILEYFASAAAEGQLRPRLGLARFYARGLGVPKDVGRAVSLLKATPHEDARRLLEEIAAPAP